MQTLVQILVQHKYDFGEVLGKEGEGVFLKEFRERVLSLYRRHRDNSLRTEGRLTISLSLART